MQPERVWNNMGHLLRHLKPLSWHLFLPYPNPDFGGVNKISNNINNSFEIDMAMPPAGFERAVVQQQAQLTSKQHFKGQWKHQSLVCQWPDGFKCLVLWNSYLEYYLNLIETIMKHNLSEFEEWFLEHRVASKKGTCSSSCQVFVVIQPSDDHLTAPSFSEARNRAACHINNICWWLHWKLKQVLQQ